MPIRSLHLAAALAAAGYRAGRDGPPQAYFAARAPGGASPARGAAVMPRPAHVERYVVGVAGGPDSAPVERYGYRAGLGTWPVDVYYRRHGGAYAVYARHQ